jgi:hypothetical protein
MVNEHAYKCSSFLSIAEAYLNSELNPISNSTGLTGDVVQGKE